MADHENGPTTTLRRKLRKPRGRGLRTTTGCTTCRQRHLKCDEEKPLCRNCARRGRECDYGASQSIVQPSHTDVCCPSTGDQALTALPFNRLNMLRQVLTIPQDPVTIERGNDLSTADELGYENSTTNIGSDVNGEAIVDADEDTHPSATATVDPPVYSPISTLSSTASQGPEAGPLRWFSLVATDFQTSRHAASTFQSIFDRAARSDAPVSSSSPLVPDTHRSELAAGGPNFHPDVNFRHSLRASRDELSSWQWHAQVTLRDNEIPILQTFCEKIASWLDVLDPMKHFGSALPQLALRNEGLMKAMLALAARYISLQDGFSDQHSVDQTIALQYYHDTLQYLHNAMKHPEYLKSIEVNATSLILSTYEMIDGMGRGWIRHLKGVFWIQRSQDTSAESGGLKAAIWWAWLRQDTWAALRERRKVLTIYNPTVAIRDLDFWQHANFISFLFALCVSYMSEEAQAEGVQLQARIDRARYLSGVLEEWYSYLPESFKAIPLALPGFPKDLAIRPVWINPPSFGTVLQMYQASRVILLSHAPAIGGFREFSSRNRQLADAIDVVCGIAMNINDGGSSLISTSCLWASGLCSQDDTRRETITGLIRSHRDTIGWPITDLGDELRQEWAKWA